MQAELDRYLSTPNQCEWINATPYRRFQRKGEGLFAQIVDQSFFPNNLSWDMTECFPDLKRWSSVVPNEHAPDKPHRYSNVTFINPQGNSGIALRYTEYNDGIEILVEEEYTGDIERATVGGINSPLKLEYIEGGLSKITLQGDFVPPLDPQSSTSRRLLIIDNLGDGKFHWIDVEKVLTNEIVGVEDPDTGLTEKQWQGVERGHEHGLGTASYGTAIPLLDHQFVIRRAEGLSVECFARGSKKWDVNNIPLTVSISQIKALLEDLLSDPRPIRDLLPIAASFAS